MKILEQFKAARRVSVPLIAIKTPDMASTIRTVGETLNGKAPVVCWDVIGGLRALNDKGQTALADALPDGGPGDVANPAEAMRVALAFPEGTVLFLMNAQRHLDNAATAQAAWNLRDPFKSNRRTLVMLAPDIILPPELARDVLILDEPYPTPDELANIIIEAHEAAQLPNPKDSVTSKAVDAVAGLAAFPAEQSVAMSLTKAGMDLEGLWERKRSLIEQTPGLSVWRGGETFADVAGLANIKTFLSRLIGGKDPFRAVAFLDELEKMAGGGESSHETTQAQQEAFLSWMQNTRALGIILTGVAGAGKSLTAKAAGGQAGVPVVMMSLSALRGSLVGQTEQNTRTAFKAIDAIAQGRVLLIATCNRMGALTPEIRSRFRLGIFFYDFPDETEAAALWKMFRAKFKVPEKDAQPEAKNWVGREIESCCELSYLLGIPLKEAAGYIVPVAQSAAAEVEAVRAFASGRFIGASKPGVYTNQKAAPSGRKFEIA